MAQNLWSDKDTSTARDLIRRGATKAEFMEVLGRTKSAAHSRIKWLDNSRYRDRAAERATIRRTPRIRIVPGISAARFVPPHIIADTERRNAAARSITAFVLGDPVLSQSALYRKNAEALA